MAGSPDDAGRRDRFAVIYDANHRHILGYALRRVGLDDASDLVSETFIVALRRLDARCATRAKGLHGRTRNLPSHTRPTGALRAPGVRSGPAVRDPLPCVTCLSTHTAADGGGLLARPGKSGSSEQPGAYDCGFGGLSRSPATPAAGRRDARSQAVSASGRMHQGHSIRAAPVARRVLANHRRGERRRGRVRGHQLPAHNDRLKVSLVSTPSGRATRQVLVR